MEADCQPIYLTIIIIFLEYVLWFEETLSISHLNELLTFFYKIINN